MKKSLLGIVALAGMLMATSCSQDDLSFKGGKGDVTFSVGVNNPMLTRAISDGTGANKLVYQLYQDGQAVGDQQTMDVASYPTEVSFTNLEVGQTYTVVFWAQNSQCEAYNTADLTAITVDYTGAKDNDETRDAFYASKPFTVLGGETSESYDVTLKRPFAQVNVGMLEKQLNGVNYSNSSMTLSGGVNNVFSALTGQASGSDDQDVTFALNAVPDETLSVGEPATEYVWLSMAYVLPGDNVSASFIFEGTPNNATLDIDNVPIQENMRTNILGNVATGDVTINVDQDPNFAGDTNLEGELSAGGVIVNNFTYSLEDGVLKLSASYSGVPAEVDKAQFILTPTTAPQTIRTRAEGDIVLDAELNTDDQTISYEGTPALVPGQYYAISVFIVDVDEAEYTLTPTGANSPGFTTPEATEPEPGDDVIVVTAEEFNALPLTSEDSAETYQLKGTVTGIYNTAYGNFYLQDETGKALIYGLYTAEGGSFAETGVKEGDVITLKGHAKRYNNDNEIINGTLVSIDEYAVVFGNVSVETEGQSATFTVTYTNDHNTAITKSGFVYSFNGQNTPVEATASDGKMTATVNNLEYGSYSVYAYINTAESKTASFRLSDAEAGEDVTYTISWQKYGKNGPNSSYTGSGTMSFDGIDWVLQGNSQINPWRLGGKSISDTDRALYSATAIPQNIHTIVLENGGNTATVNSFKIIVAKDADFNTVLNTFDYPTFTKNETVTVARPEGSDWTNCYYKVVYNVTCTGSSNQYVEMKQLTLTGN